MRVFLYVRVSTEEQALHGLSIEAQTTALQTWAQEQGHQVAGLYIDAGISARKAASNRPQLQRLLADVRAGRGDLIAFTKLDRWFRNIAEYYKVQEVLEQHHVHWRTIHEDYDTSSASGRLKVNIMLSVAQDEADRTGERIKAILQDKIRKGQVAGGKVPLGYKIENKKMAVDPESAPIVQDMFRQYMAIRSINSLRKYVLDKYGISYWTTGLKMLLQNQRYIGRAHGQDNFCPPLIDSAVFWQVQELMAQRSQRNSGRSDRVYLFTGLVFCAECGNRLSAQSIKNNYIYYRCTRYEKLHLCSHKKRTNELVLEEWLLENLVSSYEKYNDMLLKQKQTPASPKVDQARIRRKLEKLKDLYLNDLIDRDIYQADYTALQNQLCKAQDLERTLPQPVDTQEIKNALEAYYKLERLEQKEFWGRMVGKIKITSDDRFFVSPVSQK